MTPTILVLTDFSVAADHALDYAAGIAGLLGAQLVLLHVNTHTSLLDPALLTGEHPDRNEEATGLALNTLLSRLTVPARAEIGTGTLTKVVAAVADRYPVGLLVVGRPETENLPEELVTTTALDLLRTSPYPLLVVPYNVHASLPPRAILLAVDDEPFTLRAEASLACQLLHTTAGPVAVVHVAPFELDYGVTSAAALKAVIALQESEATLHCVVNEHPSDGILATVANLRPDLIVLIARPRSFLGQFFHHSVTAQLIRQSPIPLLVLPALSQALGPASPVRTQKIFVADEAALPS